jgi:hypothetical protein
MAAFCKYYTNHASKLSGQMQSFGCLTVGYILTNNCKICEDDKSAQSKKLVTFSGNNRRFPM